MCAREREQNREGEKVKRREFVKSWWLYRKTRQARVEDETHFRCPLRLIMKIFGCAVMVLSNLVFPNEIRVGKNVHTRDIRFMSCVYVCACVCVCMCVRVCVCVCV